MIKFMIKYGKYDHLKQIVDGALRMTSSQTYIGIEKEQHNKGQGDLLERQVLRLRGSYDQEKGPV